MIFSDVTEQLGPLISVEASAAAPAFAVDRDLVTNRAVREWLARSGAPRPRLFVDGDDTEPATGLSPTEATSFAASLGMRLRVERRGHVDDEVALSTWRGRRKLVIARV